MGQHHGPWGDLRVWGHQPEGGTGQVREEKNPRTNRRGRGGEPTEARQMGALPSSGGPWSASSHCGHQRAAAEQSTGRCGPHAPPAAAWGQPAACPPPCPLSQDKGQVQAGDARAAAPADRAGQATRKEQQGTHRAEGSWRTGSPGDCREHGTRLGSSGSGPAPTHPVSEHEGGSPDSAGAIPAGQAPAWTPPQLKGVRGREEQSPGPHLPQPRAGPPRP